MRLEVHSKLPLCDCWGGLRNGVIWGHKRAAIFVDPKRGVIFSAEKSED